MGNVALLTPGKGDPRAVADPDQHDPEPLLATTLFERPKSQERTSNQLVQPITGEKIRFTNVEQEQPIGELSAYYVHPGKEPTGVAQLSYRLTGNSSADDNPSLGSLVAFINGRYPPDERMTMVATGAGGIGRGGRAGGFAAAGPPVVGGDGGEGLTALDGVAAPAGVAADAAPPADGTPAAAGAQGGRRGGFGGARTSQTGLPLVHILIPVSFRGAQGGRGGATWQNIDGGLDGIAIDLPALNLKPTHGEYIPMNIQIKDPIWPMRNMFDFSFSVKPGEPHTLWLDTRDRILPNDKSLYITIASASTSSDHARSKGRRCA
jgi:hypothetical protein